MPRISLPIVMLAAALFATPAQAQATPAIGLRGGVIRTPDHTVVGLQTELARVLDGGKLAPSLDVGLELTAGLNVPMRDGRRYNVEVRFGFGDVPEFGLTAAVLFPI